MSFRTRMFLHFAWIATLMVVLSIIVVNERVIHFATGRERADLKLAPDRFATFFSAKMEVLIAQAANISTDPSLRGTLSTGDRATVAQAADQLHALYNTDLFWVLSPEGEVLHRVEEPQRFGSDLSRRAIVRDARNGFDSGGVWRREGRLVQVAAAPITAGRMELGILVVGMYFERWITRDFTELTGTHLAFIRGDTCLAGPDTTVDRADLRGAVEQLRERGELEASHLPSIPWRGRGPGSRPPEAPSIQFTAGGERAIGAVFALQDAAFTTVAHGLVFRSLAPVSDMLSRIRSSMIVVGAVTVLLALVATFYLARRLTDPINRLVASAGRLGRGDLDSPVRLQQEDEIGQLSRALDEMRVSLKQAREELIRTERLSAIGQMASTITHDFRQPIAAIYGFMQLIAMPGASEEQRREFADKVMRQIERMQGMINELLDFARGEYALNPEPVQIAPFLQEIAEHYEAESRSLEVELVVRADCESTVVMDRSRVERGIENLIRNALQAIGRKGRIELAAECSGEQVHFTIADDGPGIPEEIRVNLFEAFVTHGKKQGTGLGLAVARGVIEEHGGQISVESEAGVGTTFHIRLPLRPSQKEPGA